MFFTFLVNQVFLSGGWWDPFLRSFILQCWWESGLCQSLCRVHPTLAVTPSSSGHPCPLPPALPWSHRALPQLLPSPSLSKGPQLCTVLQKWEKQFHGKWILWWLRKPHTWRKMQHLTTGFQRCSDGFCPLTHKNTIQHLLCMLTTEDFKP